jgi:hypothetical protein
MRQLCHFFRADPDYGTRVAKHLGIDMAAMMQAAAQHGPTVEAKAAAALKV